MKHFKLFIVLFSLIFFSTMSFSRAVQTYLLNDTWVAIGINSVYENTQSSQTWENDNLQVITDRADSLNTHITSTNSAYGYSLSGGSSSTNSAGATSTTVNSTVFLNSTISVFAIKGVITANNITLSNSASRAVHMKLLSTHSKKNILSHVMYIKGKKDPAVKITYQIDYEGDSFKIKFGSESAQNKTSYIGYFNSENTYNNPAILKEDTTEVVNALQEVKIIDAIDFNISDNDILEMDNNLYSTATYLKTYINSGSIVAYKFENGYWKTFNTKNIKSNSNDFNTFNVGGAYWVKVHSDTSDKVGLISSSVGTIQPQVYENMPDGWSMATFSDDYFTRTKQGRARYKYSLDLIYSPTAMFIPEDVLTIEGINLFFEPYSSNTTSVLERNISLQITNTGRYKNTTDIAQGIHIAVLARNKFFNDNINMRAFPSMNRQGDPGLIVMSNDIFEVNSSNSSIVNVSSRSLLQKSATGYGTSYGDSFLAFHMMGLAGVDINASMEVGFSILDKPSSLVTDLNISNNLTKINLIYAKIQEASIGTTTQEVQGDIYLVSLDFNSSQDYNASNLFESAIIGASEKIDIRDLTYVKIFKYVKNGNFNIIGLETQSVVLPAVVDMPLLVNTINTFSDTTGVVANILATTSDSYFIISSNLVAGLGDIDLREDGDNLFDYKTTISGTLRADQSIVRGFVGNVYNSANLLGSLINVSRYTLYGSATNIVKYSNTNLVPVDSATNINDNGSIRSIRYNSRYNSYTKVYSPSFPQGRLYSFPVLFTHLKRKLTTIMSQEITADGKFYWKISDLTRSPKDWLGKKTYKATINNDNDIQRLLHLKENKGYWVKTHSTLTSRSKDKEYTLFDNDVYVDKASINYFDNDIGEDGKILARNHIFHKISLSFRDKDFGNYISRSYNINAQSDYGEDYSLNTNNNKFELTISDTYMPIEDGIYLFDLSSLDEVGENFLGKKKKVSIDFQKPPLPLLSWLNGDLIVDNLFSGYKPEVYYEKISEIDIQRDKSRLIYPALERNDLLKWKSGDDESDYGSVKKIVIILNSGGLYSDARVLLYSPLKSAHVLSVSKNAITQTTNKPYSFIDKDYIKTAGVQISRLKSAIDNKQSIKLAYYPKYDTSYIAGVDLSKVVYIKEKDNVVPIASIGYVVDYQEEVFYFEYRNTLYQGVFPKTSGKIYYLDNDIRVDIFNYKEIKTLQDGTHLIKIDYLPSIEYSQNMYIPLL